MTRLETLSEGEVKKLKEVELPIFETFPWIEGGPLNKRRVALISTAGIHRRQDRPFTIDSEDVYRLIPGDVKAGDLVMSHVSVNFDRNGFQQDLNVIFPIDILRKLVEEGYVGSLADYHYSFMGAQDPTKMEEQARNLAGLLKKDNVDTVFLVPV
ncbi:glycine/sarcosine/betaine reductase selenoprotein B family protein [Chloroflexota bacterium]